ncbi:g2752 [Coccomyxa elongata]
MEEAAARPLMGIGGAIVRVKAAETRLWQQVTAVGNVGGHMVMPEPTVEDLVDAVRKLPPDASAIPAVSQGLFYMDSRAVAAMLKEMARIGCGGRAQEVFDWLRSLPPTHDLASLCDVFTFTTGAVLFMMLTLVSVRAAISLCGHRQALRHALDLVGEMRARNIACNTHTYSSLMNVAIKCGELELALDVFHQLQVDGLRANVVTYNTLIDIYGKLGRWQDAIGVLDMIAHQGLEPEARTFNTIIIACNMCGQPQEALRVFEIMTARGFAPTATTYTALISAHAKAERLDLALATFHRMAEEGCERSVITYSALIGSCEKAGRWRLALDLFTQMERDGIAPNTAIFNAAMSACAQGARAEEARAILTAMKRSTCRPDALTHTALATACQRCGDWAGALKVLQDVTGAGGRADAALYSTVIEALWTTDPPRLRMQAAQLFDGAARSGVFGITAAKARQGDVLEVVTPALTTGAAVLALHRVLVELQQHMRQHQPEGAPSQIAFTIGRGSRAASRDCGQDTAAQAAAIAMLHSLGCPCRVTTDSAPKRLEADFGAFAAWLAAADLGSPADITLPASHSPAAEFSAGSSASVDDVSTAVSSASPETLAPTAAAAPASPQSDLLPANLKLKGSGSHASLRSASPAPDSHNPSIDFFSLANAFASLGSTTPPGIKHPGPDPGIADVFPGVNLQHLGYTSASGGELAASQEINTRTYAQQPRQQPTNQFWRQYQQQEMLQRERMQLALGAAWQPPQQQANQEGLFVLASQQQSNQDGLFGVNAAGGYGHGGLPGLGQVSMQPNLDAFSLCALAGALPDWAVQAPAGGGHLTQLPGGHVPLTQIPAWQGTALDSCPEMYHAPPDLGHMAASGAAGSLHH